jgi:hypothetical protein
MNQSSYDAERADGIGKKIDGWIGRKKARTTSVGSQMPVKIALADIGACSVPILIGGPLRKDDLIQQNEF